MEDSGIPTSLNYFLIERRESLITTRKFQTILRRRLQKVKNKKAPYFRRDYLLLWQGVIFLSTKIYNSWLSRILTHTVTHCPTSGLMSPKYVFVNSPNMPFAVRTLTMVVEPDFHFATTLASTLYS